MYSFLGMRKRWDVIRFMLNNMGAYVSNYHSSMYAFLLLYYIFWCRDYWFTQVSAVMCFKGVALPELVLSTIFQILTQTKSVKFLGYISEGDLLLYLLSVMYCLRDAAIY